VAKGYELEVLAAEGGHGVGLLFLGLAFVGLVQLLEGGLEEVGHKTGVFDEGRRKEVFVCLGVE